MANCSFCGAEFAKTRCKSLRCAACRRAYDKEWRAKRRAVGLPSSGSRMSAQYHAAYGKRYNQKPEVRAKKAQAARERRADPAHQPRILARLAVRNALRRGELRKEPCEVCGALRVDGHHDDYSRPLAVRWLCRQHHRDHHAKAGGQ